MNNALKTSLQIVAIAIGLILFLSLITILTDENTYYLPNGTHDKCRTFNSYKGSNSLTNCESGNEYYDVSNVVKITEVD